MSPTDSAVPAKTLVQAQFGANAANYVTSHVHAKGASLNRLIELVVPKRDWHALDIATGAGHTALAFAPFVKTVIASDLTAEMLQEAQKLAVAKGYSNLVTQLADAEALPFADATFDLVTCRIAPHHFPDIAQFVSEVRRVSKSGGTFALVDNVAPDIDTSPGFSESELREADLAYNAFEKMRDPSHGRALTTRAWIAIVEDAGLRITHCEHQAKDMDFTNWCKTMNVSPEIVQKLRASLLGAPPALKAFLQPGDRNGSLGFTLAELILIAKKP